MTPTTACTHPNGHNFDFIRNEVVAHKGRRAKSLTTVGKYRCTHCLAPATGLPNGRECTIPRKTCLSCGAVQCADGSLPCGH